MKTKHPHAIREAVTTVKELPLGDNVIIKVVVEASAMQITTESEASKIPVLYKEVVAYGDMTHSIEIGDHIKCNNNAAIAICNIESNEHTFAKVLSRINGDVSLRSNAKFKHTIVDYLIIRMHDILSIVPKTDSTTGN